MNEQFVLGIIIISKDSFHTYSGADCTDLLQSDRHMTERYTHVRVWKPSTTRCANPLEWVYPTYICVPPGRDHRERITQTNSAYCFSCPPSPPWKEWNHIQTVHTTKPHLYHNSFTNKQPLFLLVLHLCTYIHAKVPSIYFSYILFFDSISRWYMSTHHPSGTTKT